MLFSKIRNSRTSRIICFFLAINIVFEIVSPNVAMALTSGPSQSEVQSFTPINTSDMVDLFTGDFKYNIPLMDVEGYPLNIAYNSGIGMDQEASWVGLGWNLNVGAINRTMRGLPDDFDGTDKIEKEFNMKDNNTYGGHVKLGFEIFGFGGAKGSSSSGNISIGLGVKYNNYTGVSVEQTVGFALSAGNSGKGSLNAGLGITSSADEGLNVSPSVSFSYKTGSNEKDEIRTSVGGGVSMGINSRSGLKYLTLSTNVSAAANQTNKEPNFDSSGNPVLDQNNQQTYTETTKPGQTAGSSGSAGTINFGMSTYVPQIGMPMITNAVATNMKFGVHIYGGDVTVDVGGFFSNQRLAKKNISLPAYGYLHSEYGQFNENALMDFNREKDGGYNPNMEFLPVTNYSYDVYSIAGQGIGGVYRPFRHEVGHVFDNEANTTNDSYSLGGEVSTSLLAHGGVDISVVDVNTTTGKWTKDNNALLSLAYNGKLNSLDEPYYFKEVGEKSVTSDPMYFNDLGGFQPVRVELEGAPLNVKASQKFQKQDSPSDNVSNMPMPTFAVRLAREKRNKVISTLTRGEAKKWGLHSSEYTNPSSPYYMPSTYDNHIGEISVTKPDGSRYVYGLPAYNDTQKEVSFNVSKNPQTGLKEYATGLIAYTPGSENSTSNNKGVDNFYSKVTTPAYAHSYMLTAVLSADYVDSDGLIGPSEGDLGSYTTFTYSTISGYEWRTPIGTSRANLNENTKSAVPNDDYANYVYGEKRLMYVKEIRTKNHIAIFELVNRRDGYEVNENGTPYASGAQSTKLLKSITLYNKRDYDANSSNAVPIKKANFVYDYSLCTKPGFGSSASIDDVPNNNLSVPPIGDPTELSNDGGKLTLKQIYFTYGTSNKAKFSKYEFQYNNSSGTNNYPYDSKAYDRWGNYKENPIAGSPTTYATDALATSNILPTWEFPYVQQENKTKADDNSSAWSLTKIKLPSGADIDINYETDDYAYVQNAPAMDMFKVVDIQNSSPTALPSIPATGSIDYLMNPSSAPLDPGSNNLYLIFKLKQSFLAGDFATSGDADQYFKDHYIKDMLNGRYMYFRFLVNLTKDAVALPNKNVGKYYEYISGYAQLDGSGGMINNSGIYDCGYVKLKEITIGKKALPPTPLYVNPISKAAWQTGRVNYPQLVWDANFTPGGGPIDVIKSLVNSDITQNLLSAYKGPNLSLAEKDYGKEAVMGKSWIRLYDPQGKKYGGGSRVSKLTINDGWNSITGTQNSASYGQEYTYTTDENGETISSGVAAYEPMIGGDENPFRLPNYYTNQGNNPLANTFLIQSDRFFVEEPYGESFFPAPTVGYSKIKVANTINGATAPIGGSHTTGHVIHEYYTAKDYPTITKRTGVDKKIFKPPFGGLFKVTARDYLTATQGYMIELNDMHGKEKAIKVYANGKPFDPISKVEYFYKSEGGYREPSGSDFYSDARLNSNRLDNNCKIIEPTGAISSKNIGVDFDMVSDFRENETNTIMGGAQLNLSVFLVAVYPGIVPTIWPDFSYEKTRFRSAVVTKVISRYGILEKTIATDLGSKVETSNLAYDSETGDVLVTKTFNEFKDAIYSFKYPSHWSYDLMGLAYKNIGAEIKNITFNSSGLSTTSIPSANTTFTIGDELGLKSTSATGKAWVCSVSPTSISIIDENGNPFSGTYDLVKILRSGRRNMQSLVTGNVVSLVNPVAGTTINFDKVTQAAATEFNDQWQIFRGHDAAYAEEGCCELSAEALAIYDVIKGLVAANLFYTNNTPLYSPPSTYNYGFSPIINPALASPSPISTVWKVGPISSSTALNFNFSTTAPVPLCASSLVATLPIGLFWSDIGLTSITSKKFVESSCAGDRMEICASYTSTTLPASTTCFTVISPGNCIKFGTCKDPISASTTNCAPKEGNKVNPFFVGIKGNWRMQKGWSYLADRKQTISIPDGNTDIRTDGYFITYDKASSTNGTIPFQPFWKPVSGSIVKDPTYWTFTSEVTKYNTNGAELENKDALGRYSSAVYGYNQTKPILVASNAKYIEVGYDGFEDYSYKTSDCRRDHFNFYEYDAKRVTTESHTGKYSIQVSQGLILSNKRRIVPEPCTTSIPSVCNYGVGGTGLTCNDFIGQFSPTNSTVAPKKYVLSYWVKEKLISPSYPPVLSYNNSAVEVQYRPSSGPSVVFTASNVKKSSIIDGWQRVEYTFDVPASTVSGDIYVSLKNTSPNFPATATNSFFDDIRIHPFTSNIKTFVYHPDQLRYVAELDANNFATFYEYDEEGSLIRVKKETERGIMTLKETKNHTKR